MSKIACVWADLTDDENVNNWYEDEHIPNVVAKIGGTARNAEQVEDNMFKEVAPIHGKFMTLYDLDASDKDIDTKIQPDTKHLPTNTQVDTRIYDEYATWNGEEWQGRKLAASYAPDASLADSWQIPDFHNVQMLCVVFWQPEDAVHEDVVEWFRTDFVAGMQNPDLLRIRLFTLQHASLMEDGKVKKKSTKDVPRYMSIWEFGCEDLPWELLVYLGSSEKWRYYIEGGHVQWQMSQYLVNRTYPEAEGADTPAAK
jgi:hypothetical protein